MPIFGLAYGLAGGWEGAVKQCDAAGGEGATSSDGDASYSYDAIALVAIHLLLLAPPVVMGLFTCCATVHTFVQARSSAAIARQRKLRSDMNMLRDLDEAIADKAASSKSSKIDKKQQRRDDRKADSDSFFSSWSSFSVSSTSSDGSDGGQAASPSSTTAIAASTAASRPRKLSSATIVLRPTEGSDSDDTKPNKRSAELHQIRRRSIELREGTSDDVLAGEVIGKQLSSIAEDNLTSSPARAKKKKGKRKKKRGKSNARRTSKKSKRSARKSADRSRKRRGSVSTRIRNRRRRIKEEKRLPAASTAKGPPPPILMHVTTGANIARGLMAWKRRASAAAASRGLPSPGDDSSSASASSLTPPPTTGRTRRHSALARMLVRKNIINKLKQKSESTASAPSMRRRSSYIPPRQTTFRGHGRQSQTQSGRNLRRQSSFS